MENRVAITSTVIGPGRPHRNRPRRPTARCVRHIYLPFFNPISILISFSPSFSFHLNVIFRSTLFQFHFFPFTSHHLPTQVYLNYILFQLQFNSFPFAIHFQFIFISFTRIHFSYQIRVMKVLISYAIHLSHLQLISLSSIHFHYIVIYTFISFSFPIQFQFISIHIIYHSHHFHLEFNSISFTYSISFHSHFMFIHIHII